MAKNKRVIGVIVIYISPFLKWSSFTLLITGSGAHLCPPPAGFLQQSILSEPLFRVETQRVSVFWGVAWTRPTSEAALRSFTFSAACHRLCHPSSISLKKRHVVRAYVGNYMIMWDKQYNKVLLSYLSV